MGTPNVIVVAGGGGPAVPWLPAGSTVIAADGGVDRALALGLRVDLAIGDFDSVTPAGLAAAEAAGARVERHPAAKDATDLELALDAALALEPARIVVIGSDGGRLDHLLGVLLLLGHERYASAQIEAYLGDSHRARRARHVQARGHAGRPRLAGAAPRTVRRRPHRGARVPAPGRDARRPGRPAASRTSSPPARRASTVERGCLLAVQPGAEKPL